MKSLSCAVVALLLIGPPAARAAYRTFGAGSLIIPMDTDYQDLGMLKAYGLVHALLKADIDIYWVIAPDKILGDTDFIASATDHLTGEVVANHGYRGGPFVVDSSEAQQALSIVDAWQASQVTTVHVASTPFDGFVRRRLAVAPNIGVFADGNEDIAFGYLNAAAILDSLDQSWPPGKLGNYSAYPDVLNVAQVAGPTTANHKDGALFDERGHPVYCQLMTMHWGVAQAVDEVVAEMREYLMYPSHLFCECQAVNAIENNVNGHFLTPHGYLIDARPAAVQFLNSDYAFAQMDGPFGIIGGSEPSYSLPPGDSYYDANVVMITSSDTPPGDKDVWMTGYIDGICQMDMRIPLQAECTAGVGKVSYLGGHAYGVRVPISTNPNTQGTRLFLNSLFEAECATPELLPTVTLSKSGPATVVQPQVSYSLQLANPGPGMAFDAVLSDTLPSGATLASATGSYTYDSLSNTIEWSLANLWVGDSYSFTVVVDLASTGSYDNQAVVNFKAGLTPRQVFSNIVTTSYDTDTDGDGVPDSVDTCPLQPNPIQDLSRDPNNCSACGNVCDDAVACTENQCVNANCQFVPDDSSCADDGAFCNGSEFCDALLGCRSSGNPCQPGQYCDGLAKSCVDCLSDAHCDDAVPCTHDSCSGGSCVNTPDNGLCTDDGQFCNGPEFCDTSAGCISRGDPCGGSLVCNEANDWCEGCQADGDCMDSVGCTDDRCIDSVCQFFANDAGCPDDGVFCNGPEFCDLLDGCRSRGGPCTAGLFCNELYRRCDECLADEHCSDGISCTLDHCDLSVGLCLNDPEDTLCDDLDICTLDSCDLQEGCSSVFQDTDQDGTCDPEDPCPEDAFDKCLTCADFDGDGICDPFDVCPDQPADTCDQCADADADGVCNVFDQCPDDPQDECIPCVDADDDEVCDDVDPCLQDPTNQCSRCGNPADPDNDGRPTCIDPCPNDPEDACVPCNDHDGDRICDGLDICPFDPQDQCPGCSDADRDKVCDVVDPCPDDPDPTCSCSDADGDDICDEIDPCPGDATNTCRGCRDTSDPDGDGNTTCTDPCPQDAEDHCLVLKVLKSGDCSCASQPGENHALLLGFLLVAGRLRRFYTEGRRDGNAP